MPWPNEIPPDLRRRLENVLGMRSHGPAELWGEIKEWLEKHGAEAPEELSRDLPPPHHFLLDRRD